MAALAPERGTGDPPPPAVTSPSRRRHPRSDRVGTGSGPGDPGSAALAGRHCHGRYWSSKPDTVRKRTWGEGGRRCGARGPASAPSRAAAAARQAAAAVAGGGRRRRLLWGGGVAPSVAQRGDAEGSFFFLLLPNTPFRSTTFLIHIAQRLYPELENLSQLLTVCEVYCAAETKISRDLDWYGILQVEATADVTVITKHYDKLAYWLHPDKNTLPEAHAILCDNVKRSLYDMKRQHASREVTGNVIRQSGKNHPDKCNMGGRTTLSDFTMVFSTICPHCLF
ncbi:hypothetical protein SETIT_8G159900v2 [Setaria italica]|uniref:J domain-containing protein n=1 Tax=Setaria italica TaxID=4555 RepID=K3ZLL4_SETIT|nr:hypothetical protein SETIT_8G159900v2 [Setaria italica]